MRRLQKNVMHTLAVATVAMTATAMAQSTLTAALDPATIGPGSATTLRLVVNNTGATAVTDIVVVADLPAGVVVAPTRGRATCAAEVVAVAGASQVQARGLALGLGQSCAVEAEVTSSTPGNHTISATLASSAGGANTSTALTVVLDRPSFTKVFSPSAVPFGGRSRLTLTIDNSANSVGAVGLTMVDGLPSGVVVASPANAVSTCGGGVVTAAPGGSVLSYGPQFFGDASVGANSSCTIGVDVVVGIVGVAANLTESLTSFPAPAGALRASGKAAARVEGTVQTLSLRKDFIGDPVPSGGALTVAYTVLNLDRRAAATGISFSDDLDAALAGLVATSLPGSPCGAGSSISGTGQLVFTGGALEPEASCRFEVSLLVPTSAQPGTYPSATSVVSAEVDGVPVEGAPAADALVVAGLPGLTQEVVDDPVAGGGVVTLGFALTNGSPTASASGLSFSEVLPVFLEAAVVLPPAGFCGPSATLVYQPAGIEAPRLTLSGAALAPGASCGFEVVLAVADDAPDGAHPLVTSQLTGIVDGAAVSAPPAAAQLVVVGGPQLELVFDDPVAAGDTVTIQYRLSRNEEATGAATAISFSHDLEVTLAGLAAVATPTVDPCGAGSSVTGTSTVMLSGGALAPGESCVFSIDAAVPADAPSGSHPSTTSAVAADVLAVAVVAAPAADRLDVAGVSVAIEYVDDPVLAGASATLRFVVSNDSSSAASAITFIDDLGAGLAGLAAVNLPLADPCGAGSAVSGSAGNTVVTLTGAALVAGASCSFDLELMVPLSAAPGEYPNATRVGSATVAGEPVPIAPAGDSLVVAADLLALDKAFMPESAMPGEVVVLRLSVANLSPTATVTDITFSDDLDAALVGLASTSGTVADVCGVGSELSGSSVVSLVGGELGPEESCSFDIDVAVPTAVAIGAMAHNITSGASGSTGGVVVTGPAASADLAIELASLAKAFDGPVEPGATTTLHFTIDNHSSEATLVEVSFNDDLTAVLPGLMAVGTPLVDVCGPGSTLSGDVLLRLRGATIPPLGSCSFSVEVVVPESAEAGTYLNVTSPLRAGRVAVGRSATAELEVVVEVDSDGDGVLDGDDLCADTVIPEGVPTVELLPNRYALVDADLVFDTVAPGRRSAASASGKVFTTTDTGGCSCEQIIVALDLGLGHVKFGCSVGAMRTWVDLVSSLP